MNVVTIKGNRCIVNLNRKFYPQEAIVDGIKTFKTPGKINVSEAGDIFIEGEEKAKLESIAYDLCDHILSVIREEGA